VLTSVAKVESNIKGKLKQLKCIIHHPEELQLRERDIKRLRNWTVRSAASPSPYHSHNFVQLCLTSLSVIFTYSVHDVGTQ